ncbi:MAG TPA: hypothetical protein VIA82_04810 [Candidatus Limnocylindria bacterium]|jgi:hypothetical protein
MQGYEIAALYGLVALSVFLVRDRIPELFTAPVWVRLAVVVVATVGLSVPFLVRGNNLIRDRFEPFVVIAIIGGCIGLVAWLRR